MPTIRIDEDVWKALQEGAKPFVDTPNDVLRRLFRLDPVMSALSNATSGKRANMRRRIGATPQHEYRLPIVESLRDRHGSAETDDVLKAVFKKVELRLKRVDRELMENSGEPRWRLNARWERKSMALDGLLKPDSPHGLWELTEKGQKYHE
jgi:restriction system protein